MKRILAIDFGTKKCGIAITDPLQIISQPLQIIYYDSIEELINKIEQIVNEYKPIEKIVIGIPKNIDGSISTTGKHILSFKEKLNKQIMDIEIILFDEKYSSKKADETMTNLNYSNKKKKTSRDVLAAQNILEDFLLFNKKNGD